MLHPPANETRHKYAFNLQAAASAADLFDSMIRGHRDIRGRREGPISQEALEVPSLEARGMLETLERRIPDMGAWKAAGLCRPVRNIKTRAGTPYRNKIADIDDMDAWKAAGLCRPVRNIKRRAGTPIERRLLTSMPGGPRLRCPAGLAGWPAWPGCGWLGWISWNDCLNSHTLDALNWSADLSHVSECELILSILNLFR